MTHLPPLTNPLPSCRRQLRILKLRFGILRLEGSSIGASLGLRDRYHDVDRALRDKVEMVTRLTLLNHCHAALECDWLQLGHQTLDKRLAEALT